MTAASESARVDAAAGWAGAYVHVPFCARICPYCDFAVVEGRDELIDRYMAALTREIAGEVGWRPLDAVFVGGGTPSHLAPALLTSVVEALGNRFRLADDAEVTLEANPEDWTPERAAELVAGGFNRVSFGVQSFDDSVLEYLGRRHTAEQGRGAVAAARDGGFYSVSVDLIMGSPCESLDSWNSTVQSAVDLGLDHISAYTLTVERGTPLGREVRAGAPAPDPDDQADKYELAQQAFSRVQLAQYEVSNYAREGYECRYNLIAWAQGEYLAFGMGAHGHREGQRTWRVRNLDTYLQRVERGQSPIQGQERLTGEARERERLMVGLRRTSGVRAGALGEEWSRSEEGRRCIEAGLVTLDDGRLIVRRALLTDTVLRSILGDPVEATRQLFDTP